jgi:hypothetical protein
MPVPSQGHYVFTVFRLLTDFVCLYTYEFWLSLCKIVRSSVILLLTLFRLLICDRRDDTNYVLDHTYALPIATQPYIIDNEPFSIYSEIEIDTEVNAVQN